MRKDEARAVFRQKRKLISPSERLKWDDLLLINFQKTALPFFTNVLSYFPIEAKKEVNTFLITDYLLFTNPGLQIYYPKIDPADHSFTAVLAGEDTEFILNQYAIPEPQGNKIIEPEALDAVLVPLLAFDKKGYRAGYGKGFYDRFLQHCKAGCIKIGLSYFEAVEQLDDADQFDVPLDICITPQKAYVF
jgi:5-formyltetrahydrofolate cyclo-ligase